MLTPRGWFVIQFFPLIVVVSGFFLSQVEVQHSAAEDAAPCGVVREEMMIHGDDTGCAWRY